MVKLRKFVRKPGFGKFSDCYDGPYLIVDILSDVTFRIAKSPETRPKVVHHDHILPYFPKQASENIDKTWALEKSKTFKSTSKADAHCQTGDSGRAEIIIPAAPTGSQTSICAEQPVSEPVVTTASQADELNDGLAAIVEPCRKRVNVTAVDLSEVPCIEAKKRGRPRKVRNDSEIVGAPGAKVPRMHSAES